MKLILYHLLILSLLMNNPGYPQKKSTLKLAMAQMLVEGGQKQNNLNRAVERIEEAAKNKADIILLPEAMDLAGPIQRQKQKPNQSREVQLLKHWP